MGLDDLNRALIKSYYVSLALFAPLLVAWDSYAALGFLFGGVWSTTNFLSLKWLLTEAMRSDRRFIRLIIPFQIKLPLLYGAGFFFIYLVPLSTIWALVGFQIPFVMVLIEAVRMQYKDAKASALAKEA